jgi:glycosyltransferase domain-containing protein
VITLLIPTHNRPSYLFRCLSFLRSAGFIHDIIIADSSDDPIFELNRKTIDALGTAFKATQLDCRRIESIRKYNYALEVIDSPLVTICGDDDFIVPSTVSECATFLKNNEDYSHSHGRILTFWERSSASAPIRLLKSYPQHANEAEILPRMKAHFSRYANNFYSVRRTEQFRRNFRRVSELNIGRGLQERMLAALDIVDGKRKMVDSLLILRQKGLTGVDENGRRTLNDDPAEQDYFDKISFGYDEYLNVLRGILQNQLSVTDSQTLEVMECVEQDFARWKARKTRKNVVGLRSHRMLTIPRQAYRFARDFMDTRTVRSTLSVMECNALDKATAAMCDFYASTRSRW